MPRSFWLIDGYNLMHALGLARPGVGPGELEKRRKRFLNALSRHFSEDERSRVTIVFDARDRTVEGPRRIEHDGMEVVFPPHDSDADTEIEALISRHSAPRQLRVVSSDRRLQTAATRRRAQAITSESFTRDIESRSEAKRVPMPPEPGEGDEIAGLKQGGEVSDAERDYWLGVFGEILIEPEATNRKPPKRPPQGRRGKK